jgi:P4 family phage/plasmid primase-like protien
MGMTPTLKEEDVIIFKKICVAKIDYYWKYIPYPALIKNKEKKPIPLNDNTIIQHIKGEITLGLSPFINNDDVLYGVIDLDVHKPTEKAKELKLNEFKGDKEKLIEWENEYLKESRECLLHDLPRLTQELDKLNIAYFVNSSGSDGKHIRVYSPKPVKGWMMKKFLENLQKKTLGEERHEVFPKQTHLDDKTEFGNQVKGVLAVHPKTKKVSGIIKNETILGIRGSLDFLIKFNEDLKNHQEIFFEDNEIPLKKESFQVIKKKTGHGKTPNYCAMFENVACKESLPSSKATRHDYLDGNAYQYLKDKPELLDTYMNIQGRHQTAFNKCEEWVWSCKTIHKYLRENSGEGIEKSKLACSTCPNFTSTYQLDFKQLISFNLDKDKQHRIIKDILISKKNCLSIEIESIATEIHEITGLSVQSIKKTWKELKEKEKRINQALTTFHNYIDMAKKFTMIQPFFYDQTKMFWFWNPESYSYELTDEIDLLNKIDSAYESNGIIVKNQIRTEILNSLKQVGRHNKPKDVPDHWVQFKENVIDIHTQEVFTATREYFFTNPIPFKIGESSETPTMDKLFKEWVVKEGLQDETYVNTLYEIIAYCTVKSQPLQRIIALTGSGANGKGTFMQLLTKFIGDNNRCTSELDILSKNNFESSALYKKLICLMSEVNLDDLKNTKLIKKLSGGDDIRYEFKGKTAFSEKSGCTCIIATNSLPMTNDRSIGFYRRWLIIDFPHFFKITKDVLSEIPESEYENLAKKCVEILPKMFKSGGFTNEGNIEERTRKYEKRSNPIEHFISETFIEDLNEHVHFSRFYFLFDIYLKNNNLRTMSKKMVSKHLREDMDYEINTTSYRIEKNGKADYKSAKVIQGLQVKD